MHRQRLIGLIALALGATAETQNAEAQTPQYGCPSAGTVLTTTLGAATFSSNSGSTCSFNAGGRSFTRYAIFWDANSSVLKSDGGSDKALSLWPLQVGKSVTIQWSGASSMGSANGVWYYTYKVERQEKIRVPAGEFDTFVVTQTESGTGSNSFLGVSTYWYAPEVGYLVKFTYSTTGLNPRAPKDWELISIKK